MKWCRSGESGLGRRRAAGIVAVAGLCLLPAAARAQYLFGQNKVIYSARDWKVLATPHLDVYYYAEERELAEYMADFAEQVCVEYDAYFRHTFEQKIPLIVYSTHHDFKQTNVIDLLISEYVGGFTDLLRGRVVMPHTGSWTQLREVTRHELVHAYMNDKLSRLMEDKQRYNSVPPPLWFTEGLAEYVAMRDAPGTEARMFMRDFVVNDRLVGIADLWRIQGSFLMYKEGESLVRYIATRFGDSALIQILENWWRVDRFDAALLLTLGVDVDDLNRDWTRYLKRRHFPAVMQGEWPDAHGKALTKSQGINSRPAVVHSSRRDDGGYDFVYLSSASGNVDVMLARATGAHKHVVERLVAGGRGDNVESIPAFSSGPEVHDQLLAFTAKSGGRDALYIWDLAQQRQVAKLKFDALVSLSTPTWSPDGKQIVLAGLDAGGWSDLYRIDLESRGLERLTSDPAHDRDPDWSHDGRRIAWSSDREAPERNGVYHLFALQLDTGRVTRLTSGAFDDATPSWGPDDASILFSSDRDGANNIHLLDLERQTIIQVASTLGGLFSPEWTPDGKSYVAGSFSNLSFNIYEFAVDSMRQQPEMPAPLVEVAGLGAVPPSPVAAAGEPRWWRAPSGKFPERDYRAKFGLDFVQGAVAFDPDFYTGVGAQLGFTDLLGNHRIAILAASTSEGFDDFVKQFNVGVSYTNLTHRLNYTLGGFHLTRSYDPNQDAFRFERRIGAMIGLSYPLSRFRRLETTFVARTATLEEGDARYMGVGQNAVLFSNFATFVHDNTMWTYAGPIDGTRFNVTAGHTWDASRAGRDVRSAQADYRRYDRLQGRTILATRLVARGNWGGEVQNFYLGGPFDVRGYNHRALFSRRLAMFNTEVRFPLIDHLMLGLPFNALELGGFRGALFQDTAVLGGPFTPGWFGSFGVGLEMGLGYGFIMRWNAGQTHNFNVITDKFQQFFIGWNY
jgi:hypothetical protein